MTEPSPPDLDAVDPLRSPEDAAPDAPAPEVAAPDAPAPEVAAPDAPAPEVVARALVERLMRMHGDAMHRYCVAMLGWDGAAAILPTIFGHLEAHAHELEPGEERLVVLAVAHNRCVERSRTSGRVVVDDDRAAHALGRLRPVGRDAVVLRLLMGLRWPELRRVCGVPTARSVMRICRGWRNLAEVVAGGAPSPGPRPPGRRLEDSPARWAAIREDAQRFVALRTRLRAVIAGYTPAEGWQHEVWQQLERDREEQRRLEAALRAEQAAARAAREAQVADEARAADEAAARAAEPTGGGFHGAVDEAEAEAPTPTVRAGAWRWVRVGVLLAVVGLVARWLMLR